MTVEKGLVALATQMKTYVDEKDQIVLDIIQESNDKLNEVYDLVKAIPAGEQGPQGEQGLQGEVGPQGEKGLDGKDGVSITVEEAIASLIADEEFLAAAKGPQGEQGPQGEKGDNGNSVTVDELKSSFLSDEEFIKAITGPQGQEGAAGPVGEKGATGDQGPQGEIGPEGLSIKAFEITDEGALTIEMNDGQTIDLGVIKGANGQNGIDGKDFNAEEFLTLFKCDNDLIDALKVSPEDVKKHLDVIVAEWNSSYTEQFKSIVQDTQAQVETKLAVVDEFLANQEVLAKSAEAELTILKSSLEDEVKDATHELVEMQKQAVAEQIFEFDKAIAVANTKSLQLEMTIAEANRAKVQQWTPDTVIKAGQWVEHDGRYYVANRDSDSVPGNSTAYSLVLRGFEFRKAWSADTTYERLDVVISSSGSAWIANKSQPQGEPGSTPDWNLLVKRGERGVKGDLGPQGPQGEKGLDASDIINALFDYETEELTFVKSDGSKISFDMPILSLVKATVADEWISRQDNYTLPINDFKGLWNSNASYSRGDMVTYAYAIYIAKKDTSGIAPQEFANPNAVVAAGDAWQLVINSAANLNIEGDGGGITLPGPPGPRGPQGIQGEVGPTGPSGPMGPMGPAGPTGAVGPQGPQGNTGAVGPKGDTGPAGKDGVNGKDGAVGPQGPAGPVAVSANIGNIAVLGSDGLIFVPPNSGGGGGSGATGPMGPAGPQGPAGPTVVSTDASNAAILGTDGFIYVPLSSGGAASVTVSDKAPTTALVGDLWYNTSNGGLFVFYDDGNGGVWVQTTSAPGTASAQASDTPPTTPTEGQLWFNSEVGNMFIWYCDDTSCQWIETASIAGGGGEGGTQGPQGPQGIQGPIGPEGPQGIPGLGITFKARVPTVNDLPTSAKNGDLYIIDETGDAWIWSTSLDAFENGGPLVGPTGSQGPMGPQGPSGPQGVPGIQGPAGQDLTSGAYLPLVGGTMTGGITLPTTVQSLTFGTSSYNVFGASGGVAVRFGGSNIVNFTGADAQFFKPITASLTGGVRFATNATLKQGSTTSKIGSTAAIELPSDPVAPLEAATKQYVDAKIPLLLDTIATLEARLAVLEAKLP